MQHWEIVNSNRGRYTQSNSPETLWINACSYFKWCDDNPIITKRTITQGKQTGTRADIEQKRPYTIKALCLHCNIIEEYLRSIRESKDKGNEYYIVVSKILYIIYTQNLEEAMNGNFSPIMTAKVLNLEKEDTTTPAAITVNVVTQGIPELSNSENEILEKLELEIAHSKIFKEQNSQRENGINRDGYNNMLNEGE